MPELPDLAYITEHLSAAVPGVSVETVTVTQPVVLRNTFDRPPGEVLAGLRISAVSYRGPFLVIAFESAAELVMNLMLAGKLQLQRPGDKAAGSLCLSISLAGRMHLNLCDEKKMAKAYLVPGGEHTHVPGFDHQGIDILSPAFTLETFRKLVRRHSRKQVRVMINNHSILSSIGNAYADEILFEAGIHPKTLAARLRAEEIDRLYAAIRSVMAWGIEEVRKANQPIEVKVRDHLRVRNRHGQPCPRCGTTIRREGVRGYDVFFCPRCQPATRRHFLDWKDLPDGEASGR